VNANPRKEEAVGVGSSALLGVIVAILILNCLNFVLMVRHDNRATLDRPPMPKTREAPNKQPPAQSETVSVIAEPVPEISRPDSSQQPHRASEWHVEYRTHEANLCLEAPIWAGMVAGSFETEVSECGTGMGLAMVVSICGIDY